MSNPVRFPAIVLLLMLLITQTGLHAQPVTGIWEGRILYPQGALARPYQVELRIERNGDSLRGVCYYFSGVRDYVKVPIRGYFNPYDGTVRWWHADGIPLDEEGRRSDARVSGPAMFETDFNCPGEGIMRLDGKGVPNADRDRGRDFAVHLRKTDRPYFPEEVEEPASDVVVATNTVPKPPATIQQKPTPTPPVAIAKPLPPPAPRPEPVGIEEKFQRRTKTYVAEIPVTGDSLSLDFYDNAQIDGDSISIFLDGEMIASHVLLRAKPHTIRIAVSRLASVSELTMVAENLGTIPPNTSLLIAYINGNRHEVRLESTEQTSATIRLTKTPSADR